MTSSPDPRPHPVLKQMLVVLLSASPFGPSSLYCHWRWILETRRMSDISPWMLEHLIHRWHSKNVCWIELKWNTVSCLLTLAYEDLIRDPEVLTEKNQSLAGMKGTLRCTEKYWGLRLCRAHCINETCVSWLRSQQYVRVRSLIPYLHEMPVCMFIGRQRSLSNQFRIKQLRYQDIGTAWHVTI